MVNKLDAIKIYEIAESGNTEVEGRRARALREGGNKLAFQNLTDRNY